jgi:signal transduction histidine kinase
MSSGAPIHAAAAAEGWFEQTPALLLAVAADTTLAACSDLLLETLGRRREELLGRPLAEVLRCPELPAAGSAPAILLLGDGAELSVLCTIAVTGAGGRVLLIEASDPVLRQHKAIRAAQLAAVGEMAAGVAHEINNPINGIINYAQLLCDHLREREPDQAEIAGRVMREGRRIAQIVGSLLSFSRTEVEVRVATVLTRELESVLALSRAQLRKENISLRVEIHPDPPPVLASPQQLQQVILNLVHNARHALNQKFPAGGEGKILEISLGPFLVDGTRWLRLTVADRGCGIPAPLLERVCEPFFTTKPAGIGTGLGLSISRSIVVEHGGRLTIESEEGAFTRVSIDLPTAEGV